MHFIEQDFIKLKYYCKSLGLTVKVLPGDKSTDQAAEFIMEDKAINLYEFSGKSKTFMLLCLLHEVSHYREFLDKSEKDTEALINALNSDRPNKKQRALIHASECAAATYMPIIADELGLKIPKYKVVAEAELDRYISNCYYETGKSSTQSHNIKKRQEFRRLYKERYS